MVAAAVAGLGAWQAAAEPDRHVLFAAALLHDVAKPACTRFEDGRWTSPRHAKVGEGVARRLLWTGEAGSVPAFAARERVAKLVRYHGLPLRFTDRPDPARLDGPMRFEHDHHRFMYCVGRKPIEYVPHRPTGGEAFEVVLMSGLPGSGKSTVAREVAGDRPVIRLDDLRAEMRVDGGDDQSPVVAAAQERAKAYLRERRSFVWDATNTSRDMRSGLVALFANYGAAVRVVYVEAPSWAEMFARNRGRPRPVPEKVIARLAERLEIPSPAEAHRVQYVA
jgi:predicted kinase